MNISKYMLGKIEIGKTYTISEFQRLWKITTVEKIYEILKEFFTYQETEQGIEILSRIEIEKDNYTEIMADLIYFVIVKHINNTMLKHSYFSLLDMKEVRIYASEYRTLLADEGYNPYAIKWEDDEDEQKEKFFDLVGDLKSRAIKSLRKKEIMDIQRYVENEYGDDISDLLSVFDYYNLLKTRFNKMFKSKKFRSYVEIYKLGEEKQNEFWDAVDLDLMEKIGMKRSQLSIDYHVNVLDICDVEVDKEKTERMLQGLVEKARNYKPKKQMKKKSISKKK